MPRFTVTVVEELHELVEVDAEDEDEAREIVADGGGKRTYSFSAGKTDRYDWEVTREED